ncbi:hypothetical protein CapIbe_008828 [Capra ibex]
MREQESARRTRPDARRHREAGPSAALVSSRLTLPLQSPGFCENTSSWSWKEDLPRLWSGIRLYIVNVDAVVQLSVAMAQEYKKAWDYGSHRVPVIQVPFSSF